MSPSQDQFTRSPYIGPRTKRARSLSPVLEQEASNPSDRGLKRQKPICPQAAAAAPTSPEAAAAAPTSPKAAAAAPTSPDPQATSSSEEVSPPPFPWFRSGRSYAHPLVLEAATIQVSSLADFRLEQGEEAKRTASEGFSSQATITEPSPASTPRPPPALTSPTTSPYQSIRPSPTEPRSRSRTPESYASPTRSLQLQADSQASTVEAPWTPPGTSVQELRQMGIDPTKIPYWFAECYESDGYDTDALMTLARTAPLSPGGSLPSTPGFEVVGDSNVRSARDEWLPERWPSEVMFLESQFNPHKWKFSPVAIGINGGLGCGCVVRCNAITCKNAKCARFCTPQNCTFDGNCGNSLKESRSLAISRNTRTGMRGLTAKYAIPAGEIIGEYLGEIDIFGPPCLNGPVNDGYKMHLKTRTTGNKHAGIDAVRAGGKLRLMNHSCKPAARFHGVQTGRRLTVVAVTVRDVFPGEEVTVSYGDHLWFVCRCSWWGCQHRDLQHLPDTAR